MVGRVERPGRDRRRALLRIGEEHFAVTRGGRNRYLIRSGRRIEFRFRKDWRGRWILADASGGPVRAVIGRTSIGRVPTVVHARTRSDLRLACTLVLSVAMVDG